MIYDIGAVLVNERPYVDWTIVADMLGVTL